MNASPARRSSVVAALAMVLVCLTVPTAVAATGDIGYVGASYSGVSNPPTSDKPQSKLWYADGLWWANMYAPASATWRIFRLDRGVHKWVDTGVAVDNRRETLSDTLWNGSKLYIASQWVTTGSSASGRPARLYRYSYDSGAKKFVLDAGFPTNINNQSSESLTIDQDSTGRIWATWTQVSGSTNAVYVNSSANGSVWGTPSVLPGASARPAADDISAVVAFGSNKIGVMWSNQLDETMYWAWRNDTEPLASWHVGDALRGTKLADDHLNLKGLAADQAGRVFAAVKTSVDEISGAPGTSPAVYLLVFKPGTAAWTTSVVSTKADCPTRPQLVLDHDNGKVHVFATAPLSGCPYSGASGAIFDKVASIDDPVFPSGRGTVVIKDAASPNLNNVTASKQSASSGSGIVVLASNASTKRYWHAELAVAAPPPPTPPVASYDVSATSGEAPLPVTFTDTSANTPTGWAWDFGDGGTSSAQSPSHTFTEAGTYTVTLTATNASGSDSSTSTVTVTAPPPPTPPVASYDVSATSGEAPLPVTFTDTSTNTPTGWAWDFGDGGTSSAQSPSHTFTEAGTYTVTLTATNVAGSDSSTSTVTVTAPPPPTPPVASYDVSATSGAAPLPVTFTDTSTNTPTGWAWDFGDGGTSSAQSPSHTFTEAGTYTVTLTATNVAGSDSSTSTVTVTEAATPIELVGSTTINGADANSVVLTTPAGVESGDLLLTTILVRGNPSATPPSGWTLVQDKLVSSVARLLTYARTASASEPATAGFVLSQVKSYTGGMIAYRHAALGASGGATGTGTAIVAPSVDAAAQGTLVTISAQPVWSTKTPAPGLTTEMVAATAAAASYKASFALADGSIAGPGPTGERTSTSTVNSTWLVHTIALGRVG